MTGELAKRRNKVEDILDEIKKIAGDRIIIKVVEEKVGSPEMSKAEKKYDLQVRLLKIENGENPEPMTLGMVAERGMKAQSVAFIEEKPNLDYQVVKMIVDVTTARVGILSTDMAISGFEAKGVPKWDVVSEIERQYEVVEVNPGEEYPHNLDLLMVPLPSSLTQSEMDMLQKYLTEGHPALVFVDPFPYSNPPVSPEMPKPTTPGKPGQGEQKGKMKEFMSSIGLDWEGFTKIRIVDIADENWEGLVKTLVEAGKEKEDSPAKVIWNAFSKE